ncbi:MAG: MATE family efflux transporter [Clostridiaceae bacterium]|nr:MATE family efflux transporter [Clostridiaceae bacterium]
MIRSVQDMTEGRLGKQIFVFSLPLMLSNVLQVLFNITDIAVVGRFAGSAALGSVGSTAILITLFTGFLIGVGGGINVLVARSAGARAARDVREFVHTSALLSLLIGLSLAVLGLVFSRGLLELLGTKDELIDGATVYLRIYLLGMPALAVYNFGNAVLSAVGDTRRPLYFLSVAGVLNVLLNLFFVIICRLDVAGVAIASVIAQYVSAFLVVLALCTSQEMYSLRFSALRIHPKKARCVLALGIPAGLQNAIFAIANLFIQAGVNTFDATMVEGNSAATNADALVYDVMAAFYTACASFMGQNFGAGKRDRVLKSYFISLAYSFGIGAALGLLLVLFGRQFLALFTTESAVIDAGMARLTVMGCSYALSAFMDCTIAASRGLGKSFVPTVIVILGSCVFRVIWVYTIFAYFHTITSLYLLYAFSWGITSVAEIAYFVHCYRKTQAVFLST